MQRATSPSSPPAAPEATAPEEPVEADPVVVAPVLEAEGLEELGARYEQELARAAGEPLEEAAPAAPEPVSRVHADGGGVSAHPEYLAALGAVERVHADTLFALRDLHAVGEGS
jgi:hypothetical protein